MPRYRFIKPDSVRLSLSDGDWIEVKKLLTYGEQQRLSGSALTTLKSNPGSAGGGNEFGLDWELYNLRRLQIWIIDWSFRDENDRPVKITPESISSLDPDTVAEIDEKLTAHLQMIEDSKKLKNGSGDLTVSPISS